MKCRRFRVRLTPSTWQRGRWVRAAELRHKICKLSMHTQILPIFGRRVVNPQLSELGIARIFQEYLMPSVHVRSRTLNSSPYGHCPSHRQILVHSDSSNVRYLTSRTIVLGSEILTLRFLQDALSMFCLKFVL